MLETNFFISLKIRCEHPAKRLKCSPKCKCLIRNVEMTEK